jgi:rhodanese-related sulfurtransferase
VQRRYTPRVKKIFLLFGFLAAVACHRGPQPFGELTVQEVAQRRAQPNVYVFDNNTPERFKHGHVPGAKWVSPSRVSAGDLPADKSATLIFYCANPH